jgi:hypothetical protein
MESKSTFYDLLNVDDQRRVDEIGILQFLDELVRQRNAARAAKGLPPAPVRLKKGKKRHRSALSF